ncbi:A-kinase anchor protein 9-like [Uloborus diversus]|uniref:A-kinase anchor protein 9-like n=1 Tax=Uloborus diversus TaxID=327109 RepID=UPI0024096492|nr:A-kinase anchor protein 9-like [Uloborus diversus]
MQLLTAEGMIRKVENEKQRLEDLNHELIEREENLKREISSTRNKLSFVEQEKDAICDEVRALKEQCELLSSRLGDPEKTGNDKMLGSSEICVHDKTELLQENSRLSSEKHAVQKNLSRERQSFMDRMQEMEVEIEELKAEKDDLVENKCKEIRDLKAEMEAMEKQLQSNRKFIDEQAVEREQEREECLKEISKLQEFLREKERIQSNEAQMTKEIESLEQLLRSRIEDHKNTMAKKDELEKELRQSVDKIRDLREVIEELEKQLDVKTRTENELKLKLSNIFESLAKQEKNVIGIDDLEELKNTQFNSESIEQLQNLQEQVASQNQEIQTMSQSQTLLHELRGQIHFLEAKVDQRVCQLESSQRTSPIQSEDASPSSSQDSECLHIPCEDGWEMSPRSVHWLEVRRLEEKIGRLIHVDEDLLRKNQDLEVQIKKIRSSYSECEHENMALQEKLSQQLLQISRLTSLIDEQKYRSGTPQKNPFTAEKLEELQEAFEKQLEINKKMMSEPLDQSIIQNFKVGYRKLFLRHVISQASSENSAQLAKSVNVSNAIQWITKAVSSISKSCVQNCFKKAGFKIQDVIVNESNNEENELSELARVTGCDIPINDYIAIDENLCTNDTNEDITDFISEKFEDAGGSLPEDLESSEEEEEPEEDCKIKNYSDALRHITQLQKFMLINGDSEGLGLISDFSIHLQDARKTISALQDEICHKEDAIAVLQKSLSALSTQKSNEQQTKPEMTQKDFNEEDWPECFELLLAEKNEHIDSLTGELECLQKELAQLKKNKNEVANQELSKTLKFDVEAKTKILEVEEENEQLKSQVDHLKKEISGLKNLLAEAEKQIEVGKIQVDTICEEMTDQANNMKRLEEDYNLVQSMMQEKERELATLQEETDTQLKLETELESLENVLQEQKIYVKELEVTIEEYRNSASNENNQAHILMQEIEKEYSSKIEELEEQVKILKKQLSSSDNIDCLDISQIKADITEAVKVFHTSAEEETFEEILCAILNKAFGLQINRLEKQHAMNVNEINQSWEQRIHTEIASKESEFKELNDKLKKENCSLKKKLKKESEKISAERNKYWLDKLQVVKNTLLSEQERNSKLTKCLKEVETQNESLKSSLEETSREKCSLQTIANNLSSEVQKLRSEQLEKQNEWLNEFEKRKAEMQKNLRSKFKEEKDYIESIYSDKNKKLQADLKLRLEMERITELRHKEELKALHKYLEARWVNEIQKIRLFQSEELKKFQDSKDKNVETFCNHLFSEYDDKFKKVQQELQFAEEQNRNFLHHKHEWEKVIEAMKSRFEIEKKNLVENKEREFKLACDLLKEKYQKQLLEIQNLISAEKEDVARGKVQEKRQLMAQHQREMLNLKQELQEKYEKQLAEKDAEAQRLEEACRKRVEEVYALIREAKSAASHGHRSDSGSNRTMTPSSDITSSDEACSSCQEDMLLRNKHILVNKIHQDGKRVLSLVETVQNPVALENEARLWLEERSWIINRLKEVTKEPINDKVNLKKVINDLIEELQKERLNFKLSTDEVLELKTAYAQLKHQFNMQQSKVHDLYIHLNQQKSANFELETLLNSKTSELMDLKRSLDTEKLLDNERFFSHHPEEDSNLNTISSSYEIDQLRSAPEPRSTEKLSLFLPEIESIPSVHENTSVKRPVDFGSILEENALKSPEECCSPISDAQDAESEIMSVKDRFMTNFRSQEKISDYESKLHGLYWIYRRIKSYNKSLVFQKEYLIGLLRGFQMTEKVTLAWLSCMNDGSSGGDIDARQRGRSRFRAYAFAVIALQRMKFCVRRRRFFLARIPSSQVIHSRVQEAFQAYPFLSANLMPGDGSSSSYSLASVPTSLHENGNHFKENHPSSFLSSEMKMQQNSPTKSQLSEYVHRLKFLQKELGLDNFR